MPLDHDLGQYRSVVSEKSRVVRRQRSLYLSNARLTSDRTNQDLWGPLIWVRDNIECVTPLIHDLWSDRMFVAGFAYGPSSNATPRTHPLLKPYESFTVEERSLEKLLALGDVEGILEGIRGFFPGGLPSGSLRVKREFTTHKLQATIQLLFWLAEDTDFLNVIAPRIHDSWRRARRKFSIPDPRTEKTFEALGEAERVVTKSNTQLDILAIAARLVQWSAT
jgi:hypothetical protein